MPQAVLHEEMGMPIMKIVLPALLSAMLAGWYSYRNQVAKGNFVGQTLDMLIMVAVSQLPTIGIFVDLRYFYLYSIVLIGVIIYFVDTFITPGILVSNLIHYAYRSPDEATAQRYLNRDIRVIRGMKIAAFAVMAVVAVNLILSFMNRESTDFQRISTIVVVALVMERVLGNVQALWAVIPGFGDVLAHGFLLLIIPETVQNKDKRDRTKAAISRVLKLNVLRVIFVVSNGYLLFEFWHHLQA